MNKKQTQKNPNQTYIMHMLYHNEINHYDSLL